MNPITFDTLIKSVATRRLTRLIALRGLAAGGLATLTGMSLLAEEGEAKKKRGKKHGKKIEICHRTSAADVGIIKKLTKDKANKELKKHPFDTKGGCPAVTPPCDINTNCGGGRVCVGNVCQDCTLTSQCPSNRVCLGSPARCRGGEACPSSLNTECQAFSPLMECESSGGPAPPLTCVLENTNQCTGAGNTCPITGEICLLQECVRTCGGAGDPPCPAGESCIAGVCLEV